ncbi:MAG TPA: hypothetical protein VM933_08740 [Acidimicrobiales bacterium]|nr:hypothetical protein [Acidimicrobiales bacterium]
MTAAWSVQCGRSRYESADQHCQLGNLDLARAEVVRWLRLRRVPAPEPMDDS